MNGHGLTLGSIRASPASLASMLVLGAFGTMGCDRAINAMDLERMIDQPYREPFEQAKWFADGRAMRLAVRGTEPYSPQPFDLEVERGRRLDGTFVRSIPVDMSLERLEAALRDYEIFCSPCHGLDGHAQTPVARNMTLRPPPSLHEARIVRMLPGEIFATITEGAGLMPAYGTQLELGERWAVVAYVRALQLSEESEVNQ